MRFSLSSFPPQTALPGGGILAMDEIIARWAAGDAAAAEELYSVYYHRVKEFIVKRGANFVDAEDIAQEALIAGLEGVRAGRKPERLTMWLFGIARHLSYRRSLPADEEAMRQVVDSKRRSAK